MLKIDGTRLGSRVDRGQDSSELSRAGGGGPCEEQGLVGRDLVDAADRERRHTWVWRSLVAKTEEPGVLPGSMCGGPRPEHLQPFWIRDFEENYLFQDRYIVDQETQKRRALDTEIDQ